MDSYLCNGSNLANSNVPSSLTLTIDETIVKTTLLTAETLLRLVLRPDGHTFKVHCTVALLIFCCWYTAQYYLNSLTTQYTSVSVSIRE